MSSEYNKEYYEKNKDKWVEYGKKQVENRKEYYVKNRDELLNYQKEYSKNNKHIRSAYRETESYKKSSRITNWKKAGLKGNYDEIYERYINTTNCDICGVLLTMGKKLKTTTKSMEHDHISGELRSVTCHKCNMKPHLKKKYDNNTSGYKNISYDKEAGKWRYTRGKKKRFKSKIDCICYKFIRILMYNTFGTI
tara:strand:+ start:16 stop:597 length:582 start_codon:yes stop_codon:yes gene_type:complete